MIIEDQIEIERKKIQKIEEKIKIFQDPKVVTEANKIVGKLCLYGDDTFAIDRIEVCEEYIPTEDFPYIFNGIGWRQAEPLPEHLINPYNEIVDFISELNAG